MNTFNIEFPSICMRALLDGYRFTKIRFSNYALSSWTSPTVPVFISFLFLSVRPSACLSVCLSVCLYACLSICLSISYSVHPSLSRFLPLSLSRLLFCFPSTCGMEYQERHFSGNFYWANCDHIAALPQLNDRFDAWYVTFMIYPALSLSLY